MKEAHSNHNCLFKYQEYEAIAGKAQKYCFLTKGCIVTQITNSMKLINNLKNEPTKLKIKLKHSNFFKH